MRQKVSLDDKILEIFKKRDSLSTEDVTRLLREKYQIERNKRTIQRHVKKLVNDGKLAINSPEGRVQTYSLGELLVRDTAHKKMLQLLELVEEKLGIELDLTPLRLRVENLNSLVRAGAKISSHEAKLNKLKIEETVKLIEMHMNGDDPHLLDKCNLLNAVEDHLRLVLDSLVKE